MRPTLGVFGPRLPDQSGIATYIAASLPFLSETFAVTHVSNADGAVNPNTFDHVLYHIGNNPLNHGAYEALRRRSGPVILHEYINFGYFYSCWDQLPRDDRRWLLNLYADSLGAARFPWRSPRQLLKVALHTITGGLDAGFYGHRELYRMMRERLEIDPSCLDAGSERLIVDRAASVLVHSQAVADRLSARYPMRRFVRITHPVNRLLSVDASQTRAKFGLPQGFLFATMGFGDRYKRLQSVLDAWNEWRDRPSDVSLCIVGAPHEDIDLSSHENVVALGYVSDDDFESLLLAVDCGIQLRYPSKGETSGVISRFVANSMAVILSDIPEMRDYDGLDGISFVPTGPGERDGLSRAMRNSYARGRRDPVRRKGFEWEDWATSVSLILGHSG